MNECLQALGEGGGTLVPDRIEPTRAGLSHSTEAELRKQQMFTAQWTRIQQSLRAYLASFLHNAIAVDDCMQEVAVVVWKKGPWEAEPSDFLGYSLACARRIALAARRRQTDPRILQLSPEAAGVLADAVAFQERKDLLETPERVSALRVCLGKLQPAQRELVELRYSENSSARLGKHASDVGISMDCLYKKLERLRELLRICVTRRQHDDD